MIGCESTSSKRYEPPCKSRPKFIFLDKIKFSLISIKFANENKDKNIIVKYITANFAFEKYNTKYIYFFVAGLLNKLCIVDCIT